MEIYRVDTSDIDDSGNCKGTQRQVQQIDIYTIHCVIPIIMQEKL